MNFVRVDLTLFFETEISPNQSPVSPTQDMIKGWIHNFTQLIFWNPEFWDFYWKRDACPFLSSWKDRVACCHLPTKVGDIDSVWTQKGRMKLRWKEWSWVLMTFEILNPALLEAWSSLEILSFVIQQIPWRLIKLGFQNLQPK